MKNNLLVFYISDKVYINTYVEMTMKKYVFELEQKDKFLTPWVVDVVFAIRSHFRSRKRQSRQSR